MINLIVTEWDKFKKLRSFQVLLGIYIIILPLLVSIPSQLSLPDEISNLDSFYMFPNVFGFAGYIASWLVFFIMGFLGVLLITTEYNYKTLRQNIITGRLRSEFFLGKIGFIISLCLLITLYYLIICLAYGFLNTETVYLSRILEGFGISARFFLQSFGYVIFGLFLGTLLKKTGLSLFIYMAIPMFIEPVLRHGIHRRIFDNSSASYYPFNALGDLIPNPLTKKFQSFFGTGAHELILSPTPAIIVSVIFILMVAFLIHKKLQSTDL